MYIISVFHLIDEICFLIIIVSSGLPKLTMFLAFIVFGVACACVSEQFKRWTATVQERTVTDYDHTAVINSIASEMQRGVFLAGLFLLFAYAFVFGSCAVGRVAPRL